MDVCRLTASLRCTRTSSSGCQAVAFVQQGAANSLVLRQVPASPSSFKHKALAAFVSRSDSVRCQAGDAGSAKPAPVGRPVIIDEGTGGGGLNTTVLTPVYTDFLRSMSFSNTRDSCYPQQLDAVATRLTAMDGSYLPERYIRMGASFGNQAYSFHPVDLQVKIGYLTALGTMVDDLAGNLTGEARERYLEDMRLFPMKFTDPEGYERRYPGRGNLHEALEKLIVNLKMDQNPFFPTELRLHSQLIKCTFDFIEATLLEQHYQEHPIEYTSDMCQLPRFLRHKSGMAEAYAYFVIMQTSSSGCASQDEYFFYDMLYPMVPELMDVLCFCNDVMSFYKEIQEGDDCIDILTHSRIYNQSPLQSLRDRMKGLIQSRTRLMALAETAGSDEIKDTIVKFFQGYLSWHIVDKRYRLDEVLGGWYTGGFWA